LGVKPKVQIGKRNNMAIKSSMGVIAFILALNLSLLGNPNTFKKKFQVADLFLELLNTKGPKRMFA
jgi:hypothetical protein